MDSWLSLALLGGIVLAGATMQRVSGMGFALVASPLLVVLLGPLDGVVVINILAIVISGSVFLTVLRQVEYRKALLLLIPAVIGTVPGAFVARLVPAPLLSTIVGLLVIVALCLSFVARRAPLFSGRAGAIGAGLLSGFMSTTAGVGGPAISAYAIASRWPQRAFAATVQLYFCLLAGVSLAVKWSWPSLGWQEWVACGIGVVVGLVGGHLLTRHIGPRGARVLVVLCAFAGAIGITAKGLSELWLLH